MGITNQYASESASESGRDFLHGAETVSVAICERPHSGKSQAQAEAGLFSVNQ